MRNKKAMIATGTLILVIVATLSFFLILNNIVQTSNLISTEADDLKCRGFVVGMDNPAYKVTDYLIGLQTKCKKENMKISVETKDDLFKEIADKMTKCWYKYGEGEYDFMSNFKEGNWCFLCGKYDLKADLDRTVYSYEEFIDWTNKTELTLKDGNKVKYYDYLSLKYVSIEGDEMKDLKNIIEEFDQVDEEHYVGIKLYLTQNYEYINDLRLKEINLDEDTYIVYRYDRANEEWLTDLGQIVAGEAVGVGTGLVLGTVTSMLISGPVGALYATYKIFKEYEKIESAQKLYGLYRKAKLIISKIIRVSGATYGAIKGGEIANNLNTNYFQYVDVMTQEQYYRLCGTEPPSSKDWN